MSSWTVCVTVRTTHRVDGAAVAAVLAGATACRAVLRSPGVPGASVVLCVDAPTGAGAYSAALVLLVADVLPWLEGATLVDVHISTGEQPDPRPGAPTPPPRGGTVRDRAEPGPAPSAAGTRGGRGPG